ncbi:uncharacterized protein LOC142619397 [Castanea sativa]|uniref:uncharacterized protein LOC142619397 n=1 Tax=Castanea sativa TaxID=21020 RepID=UPI003F64A821
MDIQHFCHDQHPLVFNKFERRGSPCWACGKLVFGPSYSCIKCTGYYHHKSCAELPRELQHPLHPKHPLILFDESKFYEDEEYSKCKVCKEYREEYTYGCFRCNFNLHNKCAYLPLTLESEVHDHPLTRIWKFMKFTCDLCGKEGDLPFLCAQCNFCIHKTCASSYLRRVKAVRHNHPLHLTYSSLEVPQSDSPFCQLCVRKVDIDYGFYYCSSCDYVAHLDCSMDERNREDINLLELTDGESNELENEDLELDGSVDLATYIVKKINVGEDGIEILTEIKHFSHEHDLKLSDEVENNKKCDGCVRAIFPPFYRCAKCNFFLHKSCIELPRKKRHPLHQHLLTLLAKAPCWSKSFECDACDQLCNGFTYCCEECDFDLDVQCSLILESLSHKGHEHLLHLSTTSYAQNCSSCDYESFHLSTTSYAQNCSSCDSESFQDSERLQDSERFQVLRCITCEFALDFKCATLPLTTRYKQHEHPFTLSYAVEDDSGDYYCDICEEERDPKHWFYYCADCSYPAHPECILGKYPNIKFGGACTFDGHPHPLTIIEKTKDHPECHRCGEPCKEFFYQCAMCNFSFHINCF